MSRKVTVVEASVNKVVVIIPIHYVVKSCLSFYKYKRELGPVVPFRGYSHKEIGDKYKKQIRTDELSNSFLLSGLFTKLMRSRPDCKVGSHQ